MADAEMVGILEADPAFRNHDHIVLRGMGSRQRNHKRDDVLIVFFLLPKDPLLFVKDVLVHGVFDPDPPRLVVPAPVVVPLPPLVGLEAYKTPETRRDRSKTTIKWGCFFFYCQFDPHDRSGDRRQRRLYLQEWNAVPIVIHVLRRAFVRDDRREFAPFHVPQLPVGFIKHHIYIGRDRDQKYHDRW